MGAFPCFRSRRYLALAFGVALSACSGSESSSATMGNPYPDGLATDSASLGATKGIYTGDTLCCWSSGDARFFVPTIAGATTILIEVDKLTTGPLAELPQSIMVTLDGSKTVVQPLHGGRQTVAVPLEQQNVHDGKIGVHLHIEKTFIPKALGLNGDVRKLSAIIESVRVR